MVAGLSEVSEVEGVKVVGAVVRVAACTAGNAVMMLSLRRTAELIDVFCPVLTRQLIYIWNASAE